MPQVSMTIALALLAPDLVPAAVEGSLPRGIGVEPLRDEPPERRTGSKYPNRSDMFEPRNSARDLVLAAGAGLTK